MQTMNLSLDQHLPPGNKVPTSGGFLGRYPTNPSKDNKLRDPLDVRKNTNGPGTKLLLDLDKAKSPSALRRRIGAAQMGGSLSEQFPAPPFEPSSSTTVKAIQYEKQKMRETGMNTSDLNPFEAAATKNLVGGLGGNMLTNRSVEALTKAFMPREEEGCQTKAELVRIDFEDLNGYQAWSKKEIEPALRDLRKAVLANRPENLGLFLEEYGRALCKGEDPPECRLPEELVDDYANPPPETVAADHSLDRAVKQSSLDKELTPNK